MMAILNSGAATTKKAAARMVSDGRVQRAYEANIALGIPEEEARRLAEGMRISTAVLCKEISSREEEMAKVADVGIAQAMDRNLRQIMKMIDRNKKRRALLDKLLGQAFPESGFKKGEPFLATPEHFRLLDEDRNNDRDMLKFLREEILWRTAKAAKAKHFGQEQTFLQLMLQASNAEEAETMAAEIYARELEAIAEAHGVVVSSEQATIQRAQAAQCKLRLEALQKYPAFRRGGKSDPDVVQVQFTEKPLIEGPEAANVEA